MREGVADHAWEVKEHIWTALTSLASRAGRGATITGLASSSSRTTSSRRSALLRRRRLWPAARRRDEHLEAAFVRRSRPRADRHGAAPAVLPIFHRIGDRLDGRPTLLIIDEGWLALDDEGFAGQLREWLKTLRKKNASVIFATQSLSDIDGSAIAPAIIELPGHGSPAERARDRTADHRLDDLPALRPQRPADRDPRPAMPKRDYYRQSRRGNRLFELGPVRGGAGALRRLVEDRPG